MFRQSEQGFILTPQTQLKTVQLSLPEGNDQIMYSPHADNSSTDYAYQTGPTTDPPVCPYQDRLLTSKKQMS